MAGEVRGDSETKLQYLLDRLAIRDCLGRYVRGIDRHDVKILESVFWPDAQVNYTTSFSGPRDEFIAWGNELHARQYVLHQHHITNQSVDIDAGGDVAHAESYVIYLCAPPTGARTTARDATSTCWSVATATGGSSCASSCRRCASRRLRTTTSAACRRLRAGPGTRKTSLTCDRCRAAPTASA